MEKSSMFQEDLVLRKISRQDSAVYTCLAQNRQGHVAKNFTVIVNEPIVINENHEPTMPEMPAQNFLIPNDPENTTVEENGIATLDCKAKVKNSISRLIKP